MDWGPSEFAPRKSSASVSTARTASGGVDYESSFYETDGGEGEGEVERCTNVSAQDPKVRVRGGKYGVPFAWARKKNLRTKSARGRKDLVT